MITGTNHLDFHTAQSGLDAMSSATNLVELTVALDRFAHGTGLRSFAFLQFDPNFRLTNLLNNMASPPDADHFGVHPLAVRARSTPIPFEMNPSEELDGFARGLIAGSPGAVTCVLVVGDSHLAPLDDAPVLLGLTSMAVMSAADCCRRIGASSCPLSARELQCLTAAAAGATAKETARWLGISHRTVEEHIVRSRKRLNATSTLTAAAHAARRGWIDYAEVDRLSTEISRRYAAGQRRLR